MVDVTNSDYQFMAEQNKRKYLDMLQTKIFQNEDDALLSKGSNKRVEVICPFCGEHRFPKFFYTERAGHTLCLYCSKTLNCYASIIGETFGRLFIICFDEYKVKGKRRVSTFLAICECGKIKTYESNNITRHKTKSCGCLSIEKLSGKNNVNWNPNLSDEEREKGRCGSVRSWAKRVKKRDKNFCQVCGSEENLIAHHLNNYADNPNLRFNLKNGGTMCRECHRTFHVDFMGSFRTPCTEKDYEIFKSQM